MPKNFFIFTQTNLHPILVLIRQYCTEKRATSHNLRFACHKTFYYLPKPIYTQPWYSLDNVARKRGQLVIICDSHAIKLFIIYPNQFTPNPDADKTILH